ncbi:unnamed protein product [Penicillium egyptiacum]|uniref:ribonuclease Z n=1 Tax=Penicillium egyptiacum TaxID=1303716 RepID=A0A9W4KEP8_9EURO|nr:unnamed protein product [Penicillium egyptiacum]
MIGRLGARGSLLTAAFRAVPRAFPRTAFATSIQHAAFRSVTPTPKRNRPSKGSRHTSATRTPFVHDFHRKRPLTLLQKRQEKFRGLDQHVKQDQRRISPDTRILHTHRAGKVEYVLCKPSLLKLEEERRPPFALARPMKFYWQVLTTPTADTPGTFLSLHFPEKRYIFGQISEGTQRACVQRGTKLSGHLSHLFITGRTEWANNGGLIGVILTVADATAATNAALEDVARVKIQRRANEHPTQEGAAHPRDPTSQIDAAVEKTHLNIHGATNLMHTMATARRFVFRKGMPVYMNEYSAKEIEKQLPVDAEDPFQEPTWCDENIKVWILPIKPTKSRTPSPSRPQNPRKRSLDEFQEVVDPETQQAQDNLLRQSVVHDMFNSTWKMDSLVETPLSQVKMPATLFVRNPETKDLEQYKGPAPGDNKPLPNINVLVRKPWPGATVETLPPTTPSKEALCYIVRNYDVRGKFDVKKAKACNVPSGPQYAKLARGESVTLDDGTIVTSDMVLGAPRLGQGVAIMEVPSPDYLDDVVSRREWKSPTVMSELKVFFWILGPGVGEDPKFRGFVASMSHYKHLVSGTDYCPNYLALESSAESAIRLNRLNGDNYSIPVHDNGILPQRGIAGSPPLGTIDHRNLPFEPVKPGLIIDMEPNFKLNTSELVQPVNTAMTVRVPRAVAKRLETIKKRVVKPEFKKKYAEFRETLPGADAEIIALGTGSSAPSKYRNVSATLLHAPGYGYYLLDCGEGTLGQLKRVFEPEQLREVFQNLRMIYISHLHADHHLGTISVIRAWYHEVYGIDAKPAAHPETDLAKILQEKRLCVVSDEMMITWLEEYASVENFGFDKVLPLSAHPEVSGQTIATILSYRFKQDGGPPFGVPKTNKIPLSFLRESDPLTPLLKSATGLSDLLSTRVRHCRGALAASFVFPDGFKVSYSGDCRPSDKFASIGAGSTVLIHEATFSNDMAGSALAKRHSTASEALEVGKRMNARSILLTHFSQRYQKIAQIEQDSKSNGKLQYSPSRAGAKAQDIEIKGLGADPDIPLDDEGPEEEPSSSTQSGYELLDDITFPEPKRPGLSTKGCRVPGKDFPVAAAMDYMRIKVGDLIYAQAYAPALEKMIDVMERGVTREADLQKKKRQLEEETLKAKKYKKHSKDKAAEAAATIAALTASIAADEDPERKSVWSASESESGWETSDAE